MTRGAQRRHLVAVVGDARLEPGDVRAQLARELGRALVDEGFRVITGGLGGVMEEAMRGAHESSAHREGDTIAVLPGHDPAAASAWADIVIASGLDLARNLILANSDAVVAVGGGAGTLMEIAAAWQLRRPIVGLDAGGWSTRLAGLALDHRIRQPDLENDRVYPASTAKEAVAIVVRQIALHPRRHGGV